jgi:hypothetical protein
VVNFHTTFRDAEKVPEIVVRHGRALDGRLRPVALAADR